MGENPEKQKPVWYKRKWVWIVAGLLIIGGISSSAKPSSNTETKTSTKPTPANTTSEQVKSRPPSTPTPKTEPMTITNSTVKPTQAGITQVDGEIKNNDSTKHTATLKATFYDKAGKILGTAVGAVNDVEPGDTKTFSLMTTDTITGYDHTKVQVDALL